MPPRIPIVAIFVVFYLAAVVGGGAPQMARSLLDVDAFAMAAQGDVFDWLARAAQLRMGEALALAAAALTVLDIAWRAPRRFVDFAASAAVAALALPAQAFFAPDLFELTISPAAASGPYALICAVALADALAVFGCWIVSRSRRPAEV